MRFEGWTRIWMLVAVAAVGCGSSEPSGRVEETDGLAPASGGDRLAAELTAAGVSVVPRGGADGRFSMMPAGRQNGGGDLALRRAIEGELSPSRGFVDPLSWLEESMLLASDGSNYDQLGHSVAIDGTTAVLGAIGDDPSGPDSGSAYVFEQVGGTWIQTAKLVPSDGRSGAQFGWSVSVRGNTALVGARYDSTLGWAVGAAYVFSRSGGAWSQESKFLPVNAYLAEQFGYSVSLGVEDMAVVGSHQADGNYGAVYVFRRAGGAWSQEARLSASDREPNDHFGEAVAGDGDKMVVGARMAHDFGPFHGKAYIFEKAGGTWTETKKLFPNLTNTIGFGASVGISGDTVAIGSNGDPTVDYFSGAVYVFDRNGGAWSQSAKLFVSDPENGYNAQFGGSVSLLGDRLLVGASGHRLQGGLAGAAYVFERSSSGAWAPRQRLLPQAGETGSSFGISVSLGASHLVIGASGGRASGASPGRAHVFRSQPALADGASCAQSPECESGYCVDGLCCDSACGGDDPQDCQACSVAAGASANGTCTVFSADSVCRAATGVCDVTEVCDGVAGACPANGYVAAGTVCGSGVVSCDAAEACTGSSALCPGDEGPVLTCATPCASPSFGAATNLSTGSWSPQSVRAGDFNGDGAMDLVTANHGGNYIKVFLGNGSGGFTAMANVTVAGSPRDIVVGDFNEDGKADLAVANYAGGTVAVLLGSGTGTFGAPTYSTVNAEPASIDTADFDEDGDVDLIVASRGSDDVTLLFGTGTGAFSTSSSFATGTAPRSVSVGDFNGDGRADAVTANVFGGNLTVHLGTGTGSLTGAASIAVGINPRSVAVRDFNGDGNVDLAVGVDKLNVVKVMLGNGDGTFGTPSAFATGSLAYYVEPGDYNGDGILDLAVANEGASNVSILLGDGAGAFGAATDFSVGSAPHTVIAADFDGDSDLDLAIANSTSKNVSILLNTCDCSLTCQP